MNDNASFQVETNEIIAEVQKIKGELENLRRTKSTIKMNLFYDPENKKYNKMLEEIRKRNEELNKSLLALNGRLLELIDENK